MSRNTSSPGVAKFALGQVAKEHKLEKPDAYHFITKDFYVDDGITSVDTMQEATALIKQTIEICESANLHLHKFVSHNWDVLNVIPISERASELRGLELFRDKLPMLRTLGLEWCVETYTIKFRNDLTHKPITRRGILSVTSQLYDPLGLLAPFTPLGRQISQKAYQESGARDDEVSQPLKQAWQNWIDGLEQLSCININRCLKSNDFGTIKSTQIRHFSNASLRGYGACSYLRMVDQDGKIQVILLKAKTRVAPLSTLSVPRRYIGSYRRL